MHIIPHCRGALQPRFSIAHHKTPHPPCCPVHLTAIWIKNERFLDLDACKFKAHLPLENSTSFVAVI